MNSYPYLELLKLTLTDFHRLDFGEYKPLGSNKYKVTWKLKLLMRIDAYLNKKGIKIFRIIESDPKRRYEGRDWPAYADTMIGILRLNNIEYCFDNVIREKVPGDFIETGVWRGGATVFMRALLKQYDVKNRVVWVADSFEGLPKPNPRKYSADRGDKHFKNKELSISLDVVKNNFKKYDLLDDQVKFLKGWFKDTLPNAPIEKLSILRLDGDMYESTMDALTHLYPKLSIGGYIIIDDWGAVRGCKQAVLDYRNEHNITEEIMEIDWASVFWKKEK